MQVHIPLLIICVILSILPTKGAFKEKWLMPLCMLLITIYMAIRYDYGLDFWSYYNSFIDGKHGHRTSYTEPIYWLFSSMFTKYYQLVASVSIALMLAVYFWVRKLVPHRWYWLFFLCFMCIPGQSFAMMTAMRTSLAFAIISFGIYRYYIKETNWILYIFTVLIATMCHNSAIIFILIPILYTFVLRINPSIFFALFLLFSVFSFTGVAQDISQNIFKLFYSVNFIDADYYSHYSVKYVSNVNGAIGRLPWMFPAYYICNYAKRSQNELFKKIYVLSLIYFSLFFLSLDFEYRFTLYFLIYVIIALVISIDNINFVNKTIALLPVIVVCIYQLNGYYHLMQVELYGVYSEGNFFIYSTIFDNLPLI